VLLTAESAVVLLVDLQERLVPAIHDSEVVVARAVRLAEAARLLDVPIRATEQYPTGLGPTVPPLADYPQAVLAKTTFSATADPGFHALMPAGVSQIVVAGCEAHVCVLQTVLSLLPGGHRVLMVADAVGSRDPADRTAAIDRARQHGAEIVTSEMVLFEWLRDSQHPKFREVQKLIKLAGQGRTARIWAVAVAAATTWPESSSSSPAMNAMSLPRRTTRPRPVSRPGCAGRRNCTCRSVVGAYWPGPSVAITAGPRVASSIAASSPPWITPTRLRNCSVAVNATSIVPASGSIATGSQPSSAAAGGGAARPSIRSQNGPSRITRPFLPGDCWRDRIDV